MKLIDLTGLTFGRWTVLERSPGTVKARWLCRCTCGAVQAVDGYALRNGETLSCGCLRASSGGHAAEDSPTYISWRSMRARCEDPSHESYPYYGGRGISVCERWRSFPTFLADMGERPERTTIDRVRSEGNYEPGNCRWAISDVQRNNTSRTVFLEYNGTRLSVSAWSIRTGLPLTVLRSRVRRGWSAADVLTVPVLLPAQRPTFRKHGGS